MTDRDLLREALDELYAAEPAEFTGRRDALAARARAAGQPVAAKRIAGLRKPTRSAWMVNRLVRAEPVLVSQFTALGKALRAAQRSLDGTRIRELSAQRRELVGAMARRAFVVSGQRSPPAALRDEVTATLGAALADPQVAEQVQAGSLVRAVRPEGFGPSAAGSSAAGPSAAGQAAAGPLGGVPLAAVPRPRSRGDPAADRAARARAIRQRRQQAIAEAELAVSDAQHAAAEASREAEAAAGVEQERRRDAGLAEERLADARERLADARERAAAAAERLVGARKRTRQARDLYRRARKDLDDLRGQPIDITGP